MQANNQQNPGLQLLDEGDFVYTLRLLKFFTFIS